MASPGGLIHRPEARAESVEAAPVIPLALRSPTPMSAAASRRGNAMVADGKVRVQKLLLALKTNVVDDCGGHDILQVRIGAYRDRKAGGLADHGGQD